jgi:hypothetical protein
MATETFSKADLATKAGTKQQSSPPASASGAEGHMNSKKATTAIKVRICGAICIAMIYVLANSSYVQAPVKPENRAAATVEISSR